MLKPRLVKNELGQICMQVNLGPYNATLPMPEESSTWNEERLKAFFDTIVPVMTENLIAMRNDDNRKLRRKACRSGPANPPNATTT